MRTLYPPIEPFDAFRMRVSPVHELYVEQAGNPQGTPVVFFHGGPGGGLDPMHRRYFDPARYRVVLFDQRGTGKSTPHACLDDNSTWHLVADAEALRERLGIERWHVFGGSWGSTLALAYAVTHAARVMSLTLRGVFLLRKAEIHWFYQEGASWIFPDAWERFVEPIPETERGDLLGAYYRRLTCGDAAIEGRCARAWSTWEGATSKLIPDDGLVQRCASDLFARQLARIEAHYFVNRGFFEKDGWLLDEARAKLGGTPLVMVQGRYDVVCPAKSAWDVKRALPHAELRLIPDAGHASSEVGIVDALVETTDRFARG
ncbi:MAG: prolyl aminopeptidase [Deltaproteobacteria bacterium]|nr:prolyl aminopeptidase [Deltaproteobacteria bacterium]